jgi:signal peptidase I
MSINFELWLLVATIASALIALIDKIFFEKNRLAQFDPNYLASLGKKEKHQATKAPFLADYARSLFFVFLIVFLLRSFVVEPFRIPSGSMLPTLKIGDFILVNKFSYGLRMPLSNETLITTTKPERGDIAVFHYPVYPEVDFIKRIIGLPGDKISYINKNLYINGQKLAQKYQAKIQVPDNSATKPSKLYKETIGNITHEMLTMPTRSSVSFKKLKVPEGHYFVMGDNRDNSEDSRYWGFVSQKKLIGQAFMVWFSWNGRDTSIRWHQIGKTL